MYWQTWRVLIRTLWGKSTGGEPTGVQTETTALAPSDDPIDDAIAAVRRALEGLRYGQVVVIVQDGVVIQVDRTERRRLRPRATRS
jgi:hypothetical protein